MLRDIPFNRMKGVSFFYSKEGGYIMNEMAEIKDIESKIYNIRGVEVMLDSDLAK